VQLVLFGDNRIDAQLNSVLRRTSVTNCTWPGVKVSHRLGTGGHSVYEQSKNF